MIYDDNFIKYLNNHLSPVKVTGSNIICRCPWCEFTSEKKKHYHLYISLTAPIFHCFHAGCGKSGTIRKLVQAIDGQDVENFINKEKLEAFNNSNKKIDIKEKEIDVYVPEVDESTFSLKSKYIKERLKYFNISNKNIKGLVFNIGEFVYQNHIVLEPKIQRLLPYFQANFVGFLTEHKSILILRNIDTKSQFRYFKLSVYKSKLVDYYRLPGSDPTSKKIVLGEGVFDILSEYLFNSLDMMNSIHTYASGLSGSYLNLIKSVIFYEQIFRPDIIILSDSNIKLSQYQTMKKYNNHIINSLTVYYNRSGVDFNITPIIPEKFII